MSEFMGQVVIFTGASFGIGADIAVEYAKVGALLVLAGRNEENLKKTGKRCEQQGLTEEKILLVTGDLTVEENCSRLVDQAAEKFGQINILINNAGDAKRGNIEQCTVADMDDMYKINVRSVFMISQRAIPHLIKTKGSILNMGSEAGIRPFSFLTPYGVAKAAVAHLTSCMAIDLGPKGINVNCIAPGAIAKEFRPEMPLADSAEELQQLYDKIAPTYPLKRLGNTTDVAKSIMYLTSEAASFMTGAVLPLDGGHHLTSA